MSVEFLRVPPAKLRPLPRIVRIPLAQGLARRDLFEPRLHAERFLLHAARPQSLDEKTRAVAFGRGFVNPLGLNAHDDSLVRFAGKVHAPLQWQFAIS